MNRVGGPFQIEANGLYLTILGNLLPVVGVVFAGWDIYTLLIAYWCETFIIAFWTIVTAAVHEDRQPLGLSATTPRGSRNSAPSAAIIALHASVFLALHLFLMNALYGARWPGHLRSVTIFIDTFVIGQGLWPVLGFVFVQRAAMFWQERNAPSALPTIAGFYLRIVVMQLVIIVGAGGVILAGSGFLGLVLLCALKAGLDLLWPRLIHFIVDNFYRR